MKGLHTSLVIVVAAIVILIVALVVLTIFGVGITPVRSITDATAQCTMLCKATCRTTNSMPPTWDVKTMLVNNVLTSCATATTVASSACTGVCAP